MNFCEEALSFFAREASQERCADPLLVERPVEHLEGPSAVLQTPELRGVIRFRNALQKGEKGLPPVALLGDLVDEGRVPIILCYGCRRQGLVKRPFGNWELLTGSLGQDVSLLVIRSRDGLHRDTQKVSFHRSYGC